MTSQYIFRQLTRKLSSIKGQPKYHKNVPLTTSYLHHPKQTPYMRKTLGLLLEERALKGRDKEAFVFVSENVRLTFGEILESADELAAGFIELGLVPGDRIGIYGPSSKHWMIGAYAAARCGLVVLNLNIASPPLELEAALKVMGAKAILADTGIKNIDYYQNLTSICPELLDSKPGNLISARLPELQHVIFMDEVQRPGCLILDEIRNASGSDSTEKISKLQSKINPDSTLNIQLTSGTTGVPKGVLLTHHQLLDNMSTFARCIGCDTIDHTIASPLQFFHGFGYDGVICMSLVANARTVVATPMFDAIKLMESIEKESATLLFATPTMCMDMYNDSRKYNLSSLVTAAIGAAPVGKEFFAKIAKEWDMPSAVRGYGMTEASMVITCGDYDDVEEMRSTKDGYPLEGTEVQIVAADGNVAAVDTIGELCVRSYIISQGYWANEEKTKAALSPTGWWRTGDLASMDSNGYVTICGRLKDLIIRGGANIYSLDLEDLLLSHPKIQQAYVFGVPDERLGEKVAVSVKLTPGENMTEVEVKKFMEGKVSYYKVPEHVEFREDFPMTASGKVKKHALCDEMVKKFNL